MTDEAMKKGQSRLFLFQVEGLRLGQVRKISKLLNDFERAYNSIYYYYKDVNSIEEAEEEEWLSLDLIQFSSNGFWEFRGSRYPLNVIQIWLEDHHERRRHRDYLTPIEEQLRILDMEVIRDKVAFLLSQEVPRKEILDGVVEYIYQPLNRLRNHQITGMIDEAHLI